MGWNHQLVSFCFKGSHFFGTCKKGLRGFPRVSKRLAPDPAGYLYGAPIGRSPGAPSGGIDFFFGVIKKHEKVAHFLQVGITLGGPISFSISFFDYVFFFVLLVDWPYFAFNIASTKGVKIVLSFFLKKQVFEETGCQIWKEVSTFHFPQDYATFLKEAQSAVSKSSHPRLFGGLGEGELSLAGASFTSHSKLIWRPNVLLMEEILHHLGCIKPCKNMDIYHINW